MTTLLRPSEAAERLGVSTKTVLRYIHGARLEASRTPGGDYRIAESALTTFLQRLELPVAQRPPTTAGPRVLAIAHHAGGVGKTTTTSNLAYALAGLGQRICVVDLDPQGDLSERLGVAPLPPTLAQALTGPNPRPPATQACVWPGGGFDLVASSLEAMAGVELGLVSMINGREQRLRRCLAPLRSQYDYLLLDCPPNLSLLMVNALYAADGVIIPVQAQDKAYQQVGALLATIDEVNQYRDSDSPLAVFGLLLTMVDRRAAMAGEVEAALRASYGDLVFTATIPLRTDAAADRRYHAPLGVYAPNNAATTAHVALAQEVIARAG
jgi:chromosome partitioning protein